MRPSYLTSALLSSLFILAACTDTALDRDPGPGTGGAPYTLGGGAPVNDPAPGSGGFAGYAGAFTGYAGAFAGYADAGEAGAAGGADQEPSLDQPSRGSALALSPDESISVVVNRDLGSINVLALDYPTTGAPIVRDTRELSLGEGSEPWQVVIAPDNDTAFVVLRRDQRVVRVRHLKTQPEVHGSVAVGSEPTGIALSPSAARLFVANWNDGTVSVIDSHELKVVASVDLNAALVKTGYLGQDVYPRPALAHPRSLAITNDNDGQDDDESLYVTEYFAQQTEAELADGSNSDTRKVGLVYQVSLHDYRVKPLNLAPLADMGFKDSAGGVAGCYPNQLQSIALNGSFAFVVSVCASPKGPLGVKATTIACTKLEDCAGQGLVDPACVVPFANAPNSVCVDVASVKTTTAPLVSVIDTRTGKEISRASLNAAFNTLYEKQATPASDRRFPLFADDIAFVPGTSVAYVTANGSDAVFRLVYDEGGALSEVGASTANFIDLTPKGISARQAGKNPIGIVTGSNERKFALVANDVSRNAAVLDFKTQGIAGGAKSPIVAETASLPAPGSDADRVLRGKRFFDTGTARWSLGGQGWGACQSCHADGLTDNVTWYFARGPRQATSLDGSFASSDPSDQRIFNWTAIFDEVDDFEGNTRDISGGVGAIVSNVSTPPATSDRIDFVGLKHAGLNGSSTQAADSSNPLGFEQPPKLADWAEITRYMQTIRSARAPSNLHADAVKAGEKLFQGGACQGCHGGDKWTISRRFYTPGTDTNTRLNAAAFQVPTGFPPALLPAQRPENQRLRFAGGNAAAFDQILCAIRPVGTFNLAEEGVGIAERRADMTTVAQGDGNPAGEGRGYNPPSLLGLGNGAPYLHAGSARTLEALFGTTFSEHYRALSPNFLAENEPARVSEQVNQLVQYLLSIDEDKQTFAIPEAGASGGSLCPQTF